MGDYPDHLETVKIAKEDPEAVRNFAERVDDPLQSKLIDIVESVTESVDPRYVYVVKSTTGKVKIGRSKHPDKRVRQLSTGSPEELELFDKLKVQNAREIEQKMHDEFSEFRTHGEWFDLPEEEIQTVSEKLQSYET